MAKAVKTKVKTVLRGLVAILGNNHVFDSRWGAKKNTSDRALPDILKDTLACSPCQIVQDRDTTPTQHNDLDTERKDQHDIRGKKNSKRLELSSIRVVARTNIISGECVHDRVSATIHLPGRRRIVTLFWGRFICEYGTWREGKDCECLAGVEEME
jgi:hypothetical protein